MSLTIPHRIQNHTIGASLFVPEPPARLYGVVRDVHRFPAWASGVRRVTVIEQVDGPGMVSEWEVSFLGVRTKIRSVLEEAEAPWYLRWSYDGPLRGWGECGISPQGSGALAEFKTELLPQDPVFERLMYSSVARGAAGSHLRRCLARLGRKVGGDGFRVGPLVTPSHPGVVDGRASLPLGA